MKKWVLLSAAGAVIIAIGVGVAGAQPGWRDGGYGDDRGFHRFEDGHGEDRRERRRERRQARIMAMFDIIDADGSGGISSAEAEAARETVFASMDTNGDGAVDAEELFAHRMRMRAAMAVNRLDENGDGVLSVEEIRFRAPPFERFDLDENGEVSKTEVGLGMRMRDERRFDRFEDEEDDRAADE